MKKEQIEKVIEEIRPPLQRDGGDIELLEVDEVQGIVKVKLMGACAGCQGAQMTLKMLVEKKIKEKVPDIKEVVAVV